MEKRSGRFTSTSYLGETRSTVPMWIVPSILWQVQNNFLTSVPASWMFDFFSGVDVLRATVKIVRQILSRASGLREIEVS